MIRVARAKCKNCGDVVESSNAKFACCTCYETSGDTARRVANLAMEYLEEHLPDKVDKYTIKHQIQCAAANITYRGFFLDCTMHYCRYGGQFEDIEWLTSENGDIVVEQLDSKEPARSDAKGDIEE